MKKEEVLKQLRDLHYNFKNYCEVETTEDDVQALEYAIKELERTAPEVLIQEQIVVLKKIKFNKEQKYYINLGIIITILVIILLIFIQFYK